MTDTEKRKAAAAAIFVAASQGKQIQWHEEGSRWVDVDPFSDESGESRNVIKYPSAYRIKPEPVTRPWQGPDDVPGPVVWLRRRDGAAEQLILAIYNDRLMLVGTGREQGGELYFGALEGAEYSTDRRTWHPCTVTEPTP